MRKRDTWLWVIYGFVLLFLYLISSTDLLIKERKNEIYPVSVILDDTTDESYQNFKKGVDRAAIELNADSLLYRDFLTLRDFHITSQNVVGCLQRQIVDIVPCSQDLGIGTRRMNTVCQCYDTDSQLEVDDDRRAGESGVIQAGIAGIIAQRVIRIGEHPAD